MAENSATVGGVSFVNKGLVGVGRIPADLKDKFGETFGSGSGMSIDAASWTHGADGYKGSLWLLPDRGYNVVGTTDYRPRLNTISYRASRRPHPGAAPAAGQEQIGVKATLANSLLLTDDKGADATGLDPLNGVRAASGDLPILPRGDNGKLALDNEAIARLPDGTMFISRRIRPQHLSLLGRRSSAVGDAAAGRPGADAQGHAELRLRQSGPRRRRARSEGSRDRPPEQPGPRRHGADAGRQVR